LRAATHVVFSIPPGAGGDPALVHHPADLDAAENLQWLCYYSTVGVYGDFGGAWIDEGAPLVPRNERSDRRVAAEQAWRDYAATRGVPLAILRLAGIYGPGRSVFDKLREGTAHRINKPGQVFNRIHVADIGRITALSAEARLEGTYNLADDEPAPPQDLVSYGATLMGVEPPPEVPFATAELTPMQRSFYADNKRVSNRAIKSALGIELLYPNYRVGLDAIWEEEQK
jgi:nucleoside-diphosphate-sugar epimerase